MKYRFGDFEVDPARFVLTRRGQRVKIEPRPLQLLIHLLERAPDAVSKDELLDALWPEVAVTEASLTRAVGEVRRALRERAGEAGTIRTVRGRGYAISREIRRVDAPADAALETALRQPGARVSADEVREVAAGEGEGGVRRGPAPDDEAPVGAVPNPQDPDPAAETRHVAARPPPAGPAVPLSRERPPLRRLGAWDAALLLVLVPIWLGKTALVVQDGLSGRSYGLGVIISPAPDGDGYPAVEFLTGAAAEPSFPVRRGDRLISSDGRDLRGASVVDYLTRMYDGHREAPDPWTMDLVVERDGARLALAVPLERNLVWWTTAVFPLALGVLGTAALLRSHRRRDARLLGAASLVMAIDYTPFVGGESIRLPAIVVGTVLRPLVPFLLIRFFSHFPEPRRLEAWERALPWVVAAWALFDYLANQWGLGGLSFPAGVWLEGARFVLTISAILFIASRNYRAAHPAGRRRARWLFLGVYAGMAPSALAIVCVGLGLFEAQQLVAVWLLASVASAAFPLGGVIALFGSRYLDADPWISTTASVSVLAAVALGCALAGLPWLAETLGQVAGLSPRASGLALSMVLAAVAVPSHRALRPRLEHLLFPERRLLEEGALDLVDAIGRVGEPAALTRLLVERIETLSRPDSCIAYVRSGEHFAPAVAHGRMVPPAFDAQGPLVASLRGRAAPLVAARFSERRRVGLSRFESAALETLDAAVILPIRRHAELEAFLCLGPKRSQDIYTASEVALLGAVADRASAQLASFAAADIQRDQEAMRRALRRYVPGAVAERLGAGDVLEPAEREVSVLFVDIRGYTGFSERRSAEEVFDAISRYTDTVSQIVRAHGGSVVEFHGDGLMAVFGAPHSLARKERAAVEAALAIGPAVAALTLPGGAVLRADAGVATGPALVGDIPSADRVIWNAIGDTTNRASRLQDVCKSLDAGVVIDEATWRAAPEAARDFAHHPNVTLRGRTQPCDVYALESTLPRAR